MISSPTKSQGILIRLLVIWIMVIGGLLWRARSSSSPSLMSYTSQDMEVLFFPQYPCQVPSALQSRLRHARHHIALALYNLDFQPLEKLIVEAVQRGVRVEVVTDGRRRRARAFRRLKRHGIRMVFRPQGGLMHHKFAVIDSEWVITGSANWTQRGICQNANHMVILRHRKVAERYLDEFYEMFKHHRFGHLDGEHPTWFTLNGSSLSVWFSPDMDVPQLLETRIRQTRETLRVMALNITDDRIANALIHAHQRGVDVMVVAEGQEPQGSDLERLERVLPVCRDTTGALLHHKSMRLDRWILFGSYNFSRSAARRNDENLLLIQASPDLLETWDKVFERLVREARCQGLPHRQHALP